MYQNRYSHIDGRDSLFARRVPKKIFGTTRVSARIPARRKLACQGGDCFQLAPRVLHNVAGLIPLDGS
jgi:hypothetical protein